MALWIILGVIVFVIVSNLVMIAPRLRHRDLGGLTGMRYAHRGLWNDLLPENSMPAFLNAAAHGFGIELDVHLTRDERLVVMHDAELHRMCPEAPEGLRIGDLTLEELRRYRLLDTDCRIPELAEVLDALDGRCPLIVELKDGWANYTLCRLVYDTMQQHSHGAAWCVEAFNPNLLGWFRRYHPQVIRGQLAYAYRQLPSSRSKAAQFILMKWMIPNFMSRPDFIAWDYTTTSFAERLVRALFRPCFAAWTVRSQQDMDALAGRYELQIFEGFIPHQASGLRGPNGM